MVLKGKIELLFDLKDRVREMELGNVAFEPLIVVFLKVSMKCLKYLILRCKTGQSKKALMIFPQQCFPFLLE